MKLSEVALLGQPGCCWIYDQLPSRMAPHSLIIGNSPAETGDARICRLGGTVAQLRRGTAAGAARRPIGVVASTTSHRTPAAQCPRKRTERSRSAAQFSVAPRFVAAPINPRSKFSRTCRRLQQ
jgi:hypothetical protein